MSHRYHGGSVWRYRSALDPACHYETAEEARLADLEMATFVVIEQTPQTLRTAIKVLNQPLRDALAFLVQEMSDADEAPEAFDPDAKL
jgi:hypothetical protein